MPGNEILVSIAMPVLNCEKTVSMAVCSILRQHYSNWELFAIDDGSSDRTVEVLRKFDDPRIHILVDGEHRGIAARSNQAISLASGEYFAKMDSDDVAYPERLAVQVAYLRRHPDVDLLGASMIMFRAEGHAFGLWQSPTTHEAICGKFWCPVRLAQPTWMGRTRWFRSNRYRIDAKRAEDRELLLRTHKTSRFAALPDVLMGYRENKISLSKIMIGRYHFVKAQIRQAQQNREYVSASIAVAAELSKGTLDTLAIASGLRYHLLPHRARPLRSQLATRWVTLWNDTFRAAQSFQV